MDRDFDVVVIGSGAAGLTAALFAAEKGATVLVLEKSAQIGGTSAISGGQVWVPNNARQEQGSDSRSAALAYLASVTLGETDAALLESFVDAAAGMITQVEQLTGLRFARVERPDYHPDLPGARWGRSLEPLPFDTSAIEDVAAVRRSPYRVPLTSAESKAGAGGELVQQRLRAGHVTQGVALVCGLLRGCRGKKVQIRTACRVTGLSSVEGGTWQVRFDDASCTATHARTAAGAETRVSTRAVVLASGGFEWDEELKRAFLACPDKGAASPPGNEGDGLRIGLRAGAALGNMTQAWWSAAFRVPGEQCDGKPLVRNIVRELALPGSILVNADGRRFANEAASYNVLGKAFQVFDGARNAYPNERAWLVFDHAFKGRYAVASIASECEAPGWFVQGATLAELAQRTGIDGAVLEQTVVRFNAMAALGRDLDFARGESAHDNYHGDPSQAGPNPNLGPLAQAPFYAIPIFLGNLGTKGGLKTDADGRVQDLEGHAIPALFACGNVAASWMGPGYPGAGGSLGPIMTAASLCGTAAAAATSAGRGGLA